jgi:hypothetical protein
MSLSEERRILLSQLVDGELPVDQANQVLADVFDELPHVLGSAEAGVELNAMLQLRRALEPWRRQEPPKTLVALPAARPAGKMSRFKWRALSLASAALLGGILTTGGFLLGSRHGVEQPAALTIRQPVVVVTSERQREIAQAFSLHESVAGPLSWYAADDSTILVSPAEKAEATRQPIAVVLRLAQDASCPCDEAVPAKTYVIVCRNNDAAAIELPPSALAANLRLRLLSTESAGQVKLQYVLVANGPGRGLEDAALVGHRQVGLGQTSLGQLALKDCLVNVDASAWVIREQPKL